MMFLVKFCGYTQAESDNVRRAIAKKKGTATLLPEIEQRFIDYSSTHYDITKEKCQEVIKPFLQIIWINNMVPYASNCIRKPRICWKLLRALNSNKIGND